MAIFGHQRHQDPFDELSFFCPSCHKELEEIEEGPYKGFFCPLCRRHFYKQPDKRIQQQREVARAKRKDVNVRKKDSFFIQDRQDSSRSVRIVVLGLATISILTMLAYAYVEFVH